jgi:ribosomal protection tetracycline resistance protein
VERVLGVLDGAVLVVSAVEGVQPQTRLLMRALQRLEIPTLIFVNKIDRRGADCERVLRVVSDRLTPAIVPMGAARSPADLAAVLAENDDTLLAAYVDGETSLSWRRLREELAAQTKRALVHPVFFGSALTGAGVESLMAAIAELLPATAGDGDGPVSGTVFKIERGPAGEKVALVRLFSGTVRMRDQVRLGRDSEGKVTAISVFHDGAAVRRTSISAGQVGKLWGLAEIKIGDAIGEPGTPAADRHFPPPTLETVVVPASPDQKGALHVALTQLAEQDPLIAVRQDDTREELSVSLYGEVQKEVVQATLATDYGVDVHFRETTTICIERLVATGEAVERLGEASNPRLATVGLRVEPAPIDSGVELRLDVKLESIPIYVYKAVEEFRRALEDTVRESLRHGLRGWQVTDCIVTLTESGYSAPGTTAKDFRLLAPIVLMRALERAGTVVCEPIHRFHLELPADRIGPTLSTLARLRAAPLMQDVRNSSCTLEGDIPAARVQELRLQLAELTRGEGVLECTFDRYQAATGCAAP